MKMQSVLSLLTVACLVPAVAGAQQKKVTCADNTIVTSDEACANHFPEVLVHVVRVLQDQAKLLGNLIGEAGFEQPLPGGIAIGFQVPAHGVERALGKPPGQPARELVHRLHLHLGVASG